MSRLGDVVNKSLEVMYDAIAKEETIAMPLQATPTVKAIVNVKDALENLRHGLLNEDLPKELLDKIDLAAFGNTQKVVCMCSVCGTMYDPATFRVLVNDQEGHPQGPFYSTSKCRLCAEKTSGVKVVEVK